jgi:hypothetical protein
MRLSAFTRSREIADRGALYDFTLCIKARAMTRAIPSLLRIVPIDDAAEMSADCRTFKELSGVVSVSGNF